MGTLHTHVVPLRENVVRVTHSWGEAPIPYSILMSEGFVCSPAAASICNRQQDGSLVFASKEGPVLRETNRKLEAKPLYKYIVDGAPVVRHKQTANGEVSYIENARQVQEGTAYSGSLHFTAQKGERLYGLGQHEDGIFNYKGKTQYLYQTNMKISLPFLLSSNNYGILLDTETAFVFRSEKEEIVFELDTVDHLSYYVIVGTYGGILHTLRELTGPSPMLPRWAFGYVQSAEHYHTAAQLQGVARRFRESGIPLDCIVQDWATWPEGKWGDKTPDKERYPDLPLMVKELHQQHIRLMVSVWPNMAPKGADYTEFEQSGQLLPNAPVYNAFSEKARALYWKQCEAVWFAAGTDAWWCDNAEPFSDADWFGEEKRPEEMRCELVLAESRKSMDWRRLNTYGLMHAKGIYENWRRSGSQKRVVNLTRSTYISGQRYGTIAWSGDISASWDTLRSQITECIQFSLCGMPYWTLDIGGFFVVKDKWENRGCGKAEDDTPLWFWNGEYNDGVNDLGYRELYVRWFQFGAFLPMFRAHGTDTPREPWHFGEPGELFYEVLLKYIHLRYRLLPYIYACAADVTRHNTTLVRSLMLEFPKDERCLAISDSYMFGHALLVCPVTAPMYYGPDSIPIPDAHKTREVYLPKGCGWVDFWTNRFYTGGQSLTCNAPLDTIPLFVRQGAILPLSHKLAYAGESDGTVAELAIYTGANGKFTLYNDEGDNYSYENGNYAAIPLVYSDAARTLTLGNVEGSYSYQQTFTVRLIVPDTVAKCTKFEYNGKEMTVFLQ